MPVLRVGESWALVAIRSPGDYDFLRYRAALAIMLTGTHPRYLPGPLQLPATRTQRYGSFTLTMPEQLDLCLRRQASSLLSKASIDEPVTWEPPPGSPPPPTTSCSPPHATPHPASRVTHRRRAHPDWAPLR